MKLDQLAQGIGARVLTHADKTASIDIEAVHAGDQVSALLDNASDTTLLVTNLCNSLLPRVAELMDVPAVCLLSGHLPDAQLQDAGASHGTVLMISPFDMFETCGRLYACLAQEGKTAK